jgi:hypothetical protein
MTYRGPTLITEPEIRWPVILVAVAITTLIVLAAAGIIRLSAARPHVGRAVETRLEGAIRQESPDYEMLSGQLVVELLVAKQAHRTPGGGAVEINATVRNATGRTVTGLELRGAVLDAMSSPLRERTVVVVPTRQSALEPGEAINVSIMLEGVRPKAEGSVPLMEVTGVKFE